MKKRVIGTEGGGFKSKKGIKSCPGLKKSAGPKKAKKMWYAEEREG